MGLPRTLGELLFDPRGRMSRQDLLVAAAVMLAIDLGLASLTEGALLYALKAIAYWIGGVGIVKRLHDTGRTGWWFLWGMSGLCIWSAVLGITIALTIGFESLAPGSVGYVILVAALMVPALAATLWLHFAVGELENNRFGPAPAGLFGQFGGARQDNAPRPADL
jgi:uncharacterized membrane protein YhaH (DUF805 family)